MLMLQSYSEFVWTSIGLMVIFIVALLTTIDIVGEWYDKRKQGK